MKFLTIMFQYGYPALSISSYVLRGPISHTLFSQSIGPLLQACFNEHTIGGPAYSTRIQRSCRKKYNFNTQYKSQQYLPRSTYFGKQAAQHTLSYFSAKAENIYGRCKRATSGIVLQLTTLRNQTQVGSTTQSLSSGISLGTLRHLTLLFAFQCHHQVAHQPPISINGAPNANAS